MKNMDKARAIIDRLEYEGENLSNDALHIVADALDEIDAANDPYMPTDEEWTAHPWAKFAATDGDGDLFLYEKKPELRTVVWWPVGNGGYNLIRTATPPADFRTTLRHRPSHL